MSELIKSTGTITILLNQLVIMESLIIMVNDKKSISDLKNQIDWTEKRISKFTDKLLIQKTDERFNRQKNEGF